MGTWMRIPVHLKVTEVTGAKAQDLRGLAAAWTNEIMNNTQAPL